MAKASFKSNDPLQALSGSAKSQTTKIDKPEDKPTSAAGETDHVESKVKRKPGRPKTKTEPTENVNIAIPVSVLAKMYIAKQCYGNNLTQYINKVIERDLEANYDKYCTIINEIL